MEVNTALLQQTMKQIRDYPELHDQDYFFKQTDCGTAACFAGWACILSGYQPASPRQACLVESPDGELLSTWETAQDLLGLDDTQAGYLFSPLNTHSHLEDMVKDLTTDGTLYDSKDYYHDLLPL